MVWRTAIILLLMQNLNAAWGANILAVFTFPSQSHKIIISALFSELAARGHNITIVSPFPEENPVKNVEEILITRVHDVYKTYDDKYAFQTDQKMSLNLMTLIWDVSQAVCESTLSEPKIQELIHSRDKKFDLVMLEAYFSDCFVPFGHIFNAPIIRLSTFGGTNWMPGWVGNPNEFSFVPDSYLPLSDKMTFWGRMLNTVVGTTFKMARHLYHLPRIETIVRNFFNDSLPPLLELEYSTSLLLLNTHFSIGYPRPLLPNVVQVGGLHLKSPQKLPQDIKAFLDEADDGVILFSMGSILKSSNIPENTRKAFLEAFSKLKQKVIWKWETDSMEGLPSNVKLLKWLPQSDVLAHPNIKLFVTHGGLLSTQEAIHRGVPIVVIPVFGDQKLNAVRAETAGFGVAVDFRNISTESVMWALNESLHNPKYGDYAKKLSRIFRDQPLKPMDQAIFWTEYVIRHKGAPHMRSAALDLSWYQYFLLDVITFLAIIVISIFFIMFMLLRFLSRKCWNRYFLQNFVVKKKKKSE